MFIFGTTQLKSTLDGGYFHCPRCKDEVPYSRKKATEYLTFYFIPVIPLGSSGMTVECLECKGVFGEEVLEYNREEEQIRVQTAVFRILISFMVHFQKTGEAHVAGFQEAYRRLLEQEIPVEFVEKEIALALQPDADPKMFIRLEGSTFSTEAKLQLLVAARKIIDADSPDEEHIKLVLKEFAELLGMPILNFEEVYRVVGELAPYYA